MVMTDDNPQLIIELKELQEALQDSILPPDDYDHHFHLKPLQPSDNDVAFNTIVDAHMENLVGAILRDVMLQGVDKDIVVLPVHDAVAVQQKHEQWAVDTMLEAWSRAAASGGSARARIKIDRP